MKTRITIFTPWVVIAAATLCLAAPQRLFAHGEQIETGGAGGKLEDMKAMKGDAK